MTKFMYHHEKPEAVSFVQLPVFLFEAPSFLLISNEAKLLYAMILRRSDLSRKNNWMDDHGRIYLYYPIDEVVKLLHCGRQKAVNTLRELQSVDLIDIKRQGCGKANCIYPKTYKAVPESDEWKFQCGTPEA